MARRRSARLRPYALWTEAAMSGFATVVTLSTRLPQIAAGTMSRAEAERMVVEKLDAARDGLAAGVAEAARIGAERAMRPAPHLMVADAVAIVEAASRPARRRVKANANRLSRR